MMEWDVAGVVGERQSGQAVVDDVAFPARPSPSELLPSVSQSARAAASAKHALVMLQSKEDQRFEPQQFRVTCIHCPPLVSFLYKHTVYHNNTLGVSPL